VVEKVVLKLTIEQKKEEEQKPKARYHVEDFHFDSWINIHWDARTQLQPFALHIVLVTDSECFFC
jgi:hypothetical protein